MLGSLMQCFKMAKNANVIKCEAITKKCRGNRRKHPFMIFFQCQSVIFFLIKAQKTFEINLSCNFLELSKQSLAIRYANNDTSIQYEIITQSQNSALPICFVEIIIKIDSSKFKPNILKTELQDYFILIFNINLMASHGEIFGQLGAMIKENPLASISLAIFILILLLLRKFHGKFVVYPQVGGRHNNQNQRGLRHPSQKKLESQEIQIQSERHIKLRGWYIKHPSPERVVVYFHQNAGNIGGRLFYANAIINNSNVNVLLVAYRGFSDSDGTWKPSEDEIMKDAVSIFKRGVQLAQRDRLPLFVFGRSLGGAAAIHVLSRPEFKYSARGLVLQNTFTSICEVVYNFLPSYLYGLRSVVWLVTSSSYKSISKIKDIHTPILFVKGRRDTLVPAKLMDALEQEFAANKGEHFALEVERGAHNDTWYVAGERYFKTLNEFMDHCSRI